MTNHPLKLGYKASAEQFGPRQLLDFAVEAEECGFDSVWVSDHFQPWRHTDGHAPFALSWLGAVGERTERVLLGTSVLTPTFRYQPAVVAQAFGTLGVLNPGRMILGVGSGESLNEIAVTGAEWPPAKERLARLREAVVLIKLLWTEEFVTFEGPQDSQVGLEMALSAPLGKASSSIGINSFQQLKKERRRQVVIPRLSSRRLRSKFRLTPIANGRLPILASGQRSPYLLKIRSLSMIRVRWSKKLQLLLTRRIDAGLSRSIQTSIWNRFAHTSSLVSLT